MPPKNRRRGRGRGSGQEGGYLHGDMQHQQAQQHQLQQPQQPQQHQQPGLMMPQQEAPIVLPASVTQIPPCKHNEWMCSDRRKHFVTLKCLACDQKWKTQLKEFSKCPDFHAEERYCPRGNECPHPHVYARSRISEAPSRKAKAEAEAAREALEAAQHEPVKSVKTMPIAHKQGSILEHGPRAQTLPNGEWGVSSKQAGIEAINEMLKAGGEDSLLFAPEPHRATSVPNPMYTAMASLIQERAQTLPSKQALASTLPTDARCDDVVNDPLAESQGQESTSSLSRCGTAPEMSRKPQESVARAQTNPHIGWELGITDDTAAGAGSSEELRKQLARDGGMVLETIGFEKSFYCDGDAKSPIK